jgi:shikimate dehydrogenase
MKLYGLIGKTLHHSFSKKYFTEKFSNEGIKESEYRNFELKDLALEIPLLKANPDLRGLNVTIPYKTDIIPFIDELTQECLEINACNCIKVKNGKWIGYNTDVTGFEKSFSPLLKTCQHKALILGTGGASNAVAFVLKKMHIEFLKVSRYSANASVISYDAITNDLLKEYTIVINTTPVGTAPDSHEYPKISFEFIGSRHYFFDLIYNPAKTAFLSFAEKQGATIKNGEDMLIIQAEESWKIWNS